LAPGAVVFLGALVRHVIENARYFKEYVVHYTNTATRAARSAMDARANFAQRRQGLGAAEIRSP